MKNINLIMLGVLLVFILGGCSNNGSAYQEYITTYNKIIETENELLQYDSIFVEVHNEENQLYETIIKQGEDKIQDVEEYLDQASLIISEGKNLIKNDQETVQKMQHDLQEAEQFFDVLKKREDGELLIRLHNLYTERLDQYALLLELCDDFLDKKQDLYDSLESGESLKDVSNIVDEINLCSINLEEEILTFNRLTEEYNTLKSSM